MSKKNLTFVATLCFGLLSVVSYQSAQALCFSTSCTGKDPYLEGCNKDAEPSYWTSIKDGSGPTLGFVYIMYSPTCEANWVTAVGFKEYGANVKAVIQQIDGLSQTTLGSAGTLIKTKMLGNMGAGIKGCGSIWDPAKGTTATTCSSYIYF